MYRLSFYLILCAAGLFFCHPQVTANNETDHTALLKIKASITHDPLGIITSSWNNTLHFCQWHGVTCGRKHNRVTALDLRSLKLTGYLSPYLGNLTFLKELHLENNTFVGPIPPEIGRLHRLQLIALYNNSLTGEIPSNISGCYSLVSMSLGNNNLFGEIPPEVGSLSHLQFLALGYTNLRGPIPSTFGNLSSLETLLIFRCNLSGTIPDTLGKLNKLTRLGLSMNKLSGEVPQSIFNLSSLMALDLGENQLHGSLPLDLGNMLPNLNLLYLTSNRFTGFIPGSLSNSSNLVNLELGSNHFQGQVPSFHKLTTVKKLLLAGNSLGDGKPTDLDFVYSLANSTNLQELEVNDNNFKGFFPDIICNFSMLTVFGIGGNTISGQIPSCIGNLAYLQWIVADRNQLSGTIPTSIGELKNLGLLALGMNQLSGQLPTSIGNLTQLTTLDLHGNDLEGQIPSTIENCKSLQQLSLSHNNLSGRIPFDIFSLPALSIGLDISYNQLTGLLPVEVGKLTQLEALDVSHNNLSGEIPSTLGSCVGLEFLNMGGNFFQDAIPSSFAGLQGLQELNLSHNSLSGKIPDFLVKLKLQRLDLSYNNFQGVVPTGGIFDNATGVSLAGNSGLCGGVLTLKLRQCNAPKRKLSSKIRVVIAIVVSVFFGVVLLVTLVSLYAFYHKRKRQAPQSTDATLASPSYQSLLRATNGFSPENLIGSGAFGAVYKGVFDEGNTIVAIKKFNLERRGATKSFMSECEVLRNIRHRNLVKVITACSSIDNQGNDFKALVYEYMVKGSLEDWLHPQPPSSSTVNYGTNHAPKRLSLVQRFNIAVDVAFALEYLHNGFGSSIVHCDLKPANVLLDDEMVAHVGDFGLTKFLPQGFHANESSSIGIRGTMGYAPPEYGLGNEVSVYGDIYSFGILVLEMFTGRRPTDDMFKESLTLHNFVKAGLPDRVMEILDIAIVKEMVGDESITRNTDEETHTNSGKRTMLEGAVILVLEIAVACSAEFPQERLDIKYVAAKLSSARNKLIETKLP